jgi:hypothetical protein
VQFSIPCVRYFLLRSLALAVLLGGMGCEQKSATLAPPRRPGAGFVNPLVVQGSLPIDGKLMVKAVDSDRLVNPGGIAVQADGKFIIAATVYDRTKGRTSYVLQRFTKEGVVDLKFGNKGAILDEAAGFGLIDQLLLYPDGRVFVLEHIPAARKLTAKRWTAEGIPDESFQKAGRKEFRSFAESSTSAHWENWKAVLGHDQRMTVACFFGEGPEGHGALLERWLESGAVDSGFGKDQHRARVPEAGIESRAYWFNVLALDSRNRPVLGGKVVIHWDRTDPTPKEAATEVAKDPSKMLHRHHLVIQRLTDDGALDASFNRYDPSIPKVDWPERTGEIFEPREWKNAKGEWLNLENQFEIRDLKIGVSDRILMTYFKAFSDKTKGAEVYLSQYMETGDRDPGFGPPGKGMVKLQLAPTSDEETKFPRIDTLLTQKNGKIWGVGQLRKDAASKKERVAFLAEFDERGEIVPLKVDGSRITDLGTYRQESEDSEGSGGKVFSALEEAGTASRLYLITQNTTNDFVVSRFRDRYELDKPPSAVPAVKTGP